jgi:hypothetical protein
MENFLMSNEKVENIARLLPRKAFQTLEQHLTMHDF